MIQPVSSLNGKKIFFASDFHLGVPDLNTSLEREKRMVKWLDAIKDEAHTIYLLGDIFDFWFEYKHAIPKGYIRVLGKLAELRDEGIPVVFFTGNHDMWMFDYFPSQLGIPIYRAPQTLEVGNQKLLIGHGDGLGPGDHTYKFIKRFFDSKLCQWLFARIHPNFGIGLASFWSNRSRMSNLKRDESFKDEKSEYLWMYCTEVERKNHYDFYLFGHRHLPLELKIGERSRYINVGDWLTYNSYAVYDGNEVILKIFASK